MNQSFKFVRYMSIGALLVAGQFAAQAEDRGQLTTHDYDFVCAAAKGGNAEVQLSQIAVTKASDQSVKDFATQMVADHTKANGELMALAQSKGATLPTNEPKKMEKESEKLQSLAGQEFDKAYVKMMVNDHEKTVKMFQKEADKAEDADLKSWVSKTLPTLQEHLSKITGLEDTIKSK